MFEDGGRNDYEYRLPAPSFKHVRELRDWALTMQIIAVVTLCFVPPALVALYNFGFDWALVPAMISCAIMVLIVGWLLCEAD